MYSLKASSTARPLLFPLFDSTDGTTPATGLDPTVTLSKNGAAFAAPAGAVSEVGSGWYAVAGNATDTDTLGVLILHATASGATDTDAAYEVVAYDPDDAAALGLGNLNATVGSRLAASDYTAPDNTDIAAIKARTDNLPDDPADASVVAGLIAGIPAAPTAAAVRAEMDANSTRLAHLDVDVSVGSLDLANGVETGITERQALRLVLAVLAGKLSGAGTTTITFRNVGDTKTRITATVDSNGDRTAVTTDAS